MEVTFVANDLVRDLFSTIVPLLIKGRKYWEPYYDLEDIQQRLIDGKMQLLVGIEDSEVKICMITEIAVYPKSDWLRVLYIGGKDLRGCEYFFNEWKAWAKRYHVEGVEFVSRKGWPRRLKKLLTQDGNDFEELVFIRKRF